MNRSPEDVERWRAAHRAVLDHLLHLVAEHSPLGEDLVLRGSMVISAWVGAEAREPADLRGALQHLRLHALAREPVRGREAGESTTEDDDALTFHGAGIYAGGGGESTRCVMETAPGARRVPLHEPRARRSPRIDYRRSPTETRRPFGPLRSIE